MPDQPVGETTHGAVGRDLCSIQGIVRGINKLERELERSHGLTLNEGLCLCCISHLNYSPGACARQIGLSASRVSRILNSLEKKGLLERRSRPSDHRSTEIVITDQGRQRLQRLQRLCESGFSFSRLDAAPQGEEAGRPLRAPGGRAGAGSPSRRPPARP